MKHTATIGSISHGTLRTEDLLDTFACTLEYHVQRNPGLPQYEFEEYECLIKSARELGADHEEAFELVQDLASALDQFAPPNCYFGAHEGDGSDFGYWPNNEENN